MFKHILVPTDGSEFSERAVRRAVAFAKEIGAEITAFYAKQDFSAMGYYGEGFLAVAKMDESEDSYTEAYARKVLGFVENLCQEAGVKCQTVSITSAMVYEGIIDAARKGNCDLIFMASHGRSGIKALLLGSETSKVLTYSKIPVLVYR